MRVPQIKTSYPDEFKALHPEGDFDAKLIEWGDIKQALSGRTWFMQGTFETEHGKVWGSVAGYPAALHVIHKYVRPDTMRIRVKHRCVDGEKVYCQVDFL